MDFSQALIFSLFLPIVCCHLVAPNEPIGLQLLPLREQATDYVLLDLHADDDDKVDFIIKNGLLNTLHNEIEQAVVIFKGFKVHAHFKTHVHHNVVIMTKNLSFHLIDVIPIKSVAKSHWSLFHIIVTNDREFKCENGFMNINDFKKLELIMNKLWHKFKLMYVSVTFPFACRNKMVYYNGTRIKSNATLYDRTINMEDLSAVSFGNMKKIAYELTENYPIKASLFTRYPTSITDCDKIHYYLKPLLNITNGFCGLDALVMHDVVQHFKFKIDMTKEEKCDKYGYVEYDNITGSLGCIIRGDLDISFNSRFMTKYSNSNILFLHYIRTDSLCALMKGAGDVPLWHYVFNVCDALFWFLLTISISLIGVTMWVFGKISEENEGEVKSICFYIRDSIMSTLCGITLTKKPSITVLRATCMICSISLVAIYQSHINHEFTTTKQYNQIRTLDDLYKSGLKLYTTETMKKIMNHISTKDENEQLFLSQLKLVSGNRLPFILSHPDTVTVGRKSDDKMEILGSYTDRQGKPIIHIIDECFSTFYLCYIARSGFPFAKYILEFLERLNEAGLPDQYYLWTRRTLSLPGDFSTLRNEPRSYDKTSLGDLRIAFTLLILGHVASIVIFAIEKWKGPNDKIHSMH